MTELPSGTVTLLFSDLEGSTELVQTLGSAWPEVLDLSRALCREAWSTYGGHEMGTEGDSFFVVFGTATAAVEAAAAAQRALASAVWPGGAVVAVRMGLHTGTPQRHGDGYVGLDVHLAARVAGLAHGGQVLVSSATAELVARELAPDLGLVDLGRHEVKGIGEPVALEQLTIAGLRSDFPHLRSVARGNLSRSPGQLVGRDGEVAELTDLVAGGARLVTLTGPGGAGKSRLAVEVASAVRERFPDGCWFVPLASATTGGDLWPALGRVLGLPAEAHEIPACFLHLRRRTIALVLDNLEQVEGIEEAVDLLLRETAGVVVVATSRRALRLTWEHEHQVPPLLLPRMGAGHEEVARSGAVELFVQHASRVRPAFRITEENAADVAAVCRALDGLPLAVELAAARTRVLSPSALVRRLDSMLDMEAVDRSRPDRQRTMRSTIDWSFRLLSAPQQHVLLGLGVCAGTSDITLIEAAVAEDDLGGSDVLDVLADLVDASFVTVPADDAEPRFGLLETIRTYALARLEAGGALEESFGRHAREVHRRSMAWRQRQRGDYARVLAEIDGDRDNLQVLFRRLLAGELDAAFPTDVARWCLVTDLVRCADLSLWGSLVVAWSSEALRTLPVSAQPLAVAMRAQVESTLAIALRFLGRQEEALAHAVTAVATLEPLLDEPAAHRGTVQGSPRFALVQALGALSHIHVDRGEVEPARAASRRLIDEVLKLDDSRVASFLSWAVDTAVATGDLSSAREGLAAVERLLARDPDDRDRGWWDYQVALVAICDGDLANARRQLVRGWASASALGDHLLTCNFAGVLMVTVAPLAPTLAARLHGTRTAFFERIDEVESAWLDALFEAWLVPVRSSLAPEQWHDAEVQGANESMLQTCTEAVGVLRRADQLD